MDVFLRLVIVISKYQNTSYQVYKERPSLKNGGTIVDNPFVVGSSFQKITTITKSQENSNEFLVKVSPPEDATDNVDRVLSVKDATVYDFKAGSKLSAIVLSGMTFANEPDFNNVVVLSSLRIAGRAFTINGNLIKHETVTEVEGEDEEGNPTTTEIVTPGLSLQWDAGAPGFSVSEDIKIDSINGHNVTNIARPITFHARNLSVMKSFEETSDIYNGYDWVNLNLEIAEDAFVNSWKRKIAGGDFSIGRSLTVNSVSNNAIKSDNFYVTGENVTVDLTKVTDIFPFTVRNTARVAADSELEGATLTIKLNNAFTSTFSLAPFKKVETPIEPEEEGGDVIYPTEKLSVVIETFRNFGDDVLSANERQNVLNGLNFPAFDGSPGLPVDNLSIMVPNSKYATACQTYPALADYFKPYNPDYEPIAETEEIEPGEKDTSFKVSSDNVAFEIASNLTGNADIYEVVSED